MHECAYSPLSPLIIPKLMINKWVRDINYYCMALAEDTLKKLDPMLKNMINAIQ